MPRSKRPRVSKAIIMPTLKFVKVNVPAYHGQHASSSFFQKAHTYLKRVYGQLTRPRPIQAYDMTYKGKGIKYIGRMPSLNAEMYYGPKVFYTGRTSIPPVNPKNPTKVAPRTEPKDTRVLRPVRTRLTRIAA